MSLPYPATFNVDRLQAKCAAWNNVNRMANELHPKLMISFADYVGKKVFRADGALTAKVKPLIPSYTLYKENYQCDCLYVGQSDYTLHVQIRCCSNVNNVHEYAERALYVGDIRNGILSNITAPERVCSDCKTDYNAAEVLAAAAAYKSAYDIASELRSALYPFI